MFTIRRILFQDGLVAFIIHDHPANIHLTEKDIEAATEVLDAAFNRSEHQHLRPPQGARFETSC